jgi:branched-chain amino acid transport system substrate-binding protein
VLRSLGTIANGEEGVAWAIGQPGPSLTYFREKYEAEWGTPIASYRDGSTVYDGVAVAALASLWAARDLADPSQVSPAAIRDAMRAINDPTGEKVYAGPDELERAIRLIREGKAINYEGVAGPCDFDDNGNAKSPHVHFQVQNLRFVDVAIYDCVSDPTCPLKQ